MKTVGDGEGADTSGFDNQALHDTPPRACHCAPQSVKDGKDGAIQLTHSIGMEHAANRKDTAATSDMTNIEEQAPHGTSLRAAQNEKGDNKEPGTLTDGAEYPTGFKFGLIILALSAVIVLVNLDMNIVATAVPAITDHFHTVADVGWYAAAFRLTLCAFQFIFGKTYFLFPVKSIFLTANIVFLFGSALCATATSSTMLVIGRAVTGLGAAGLNAGLFNILVQSIPLQVRPIW
ncbi:hypothetical protein EYB25_008652, partial [Talaromyces marneffei]